MNRKATLVDTWLWEALLGVGLLVFTGGCGQKNQEGGQPLRLSPALPSSSHDDQTAARSSSGLSFVVRPDGDFGIEGDTPAANGSTDDSRAKPPTRIGISPAALNKEFLLRANLISGGLAPSFQGLKTRVVSFREQAGKLVLAEAGQGYSLYDELPQELILARFPIIGRDTDTIYFDFNAGMTKLYTMADMYASSDSAAAEPNFNERYEAASIDVAFIKHAELRAGDELLIEQAAQLATGSTYLPVEVRYYFSPYQANPQFEARVSPPKKHAGFFEVAPSFHQQTHKSVVYAAKFDHSRPVVFAISANTPAEFKDSIRSGVLYWNQAFGAEVLQVVDAPAGVSAPSYDANIIQWVDWQIEDGYLAFADAQMDPRSGEVLNAQVFMTSSFVAYGRSHAQRIVKRLGNSALHGSLEATPDAALTGGALQASFRQLLAPQDSTLVKKGSQQLTLRGFAQTPLCQARAPESYLQALNHLIGQQAPDDAFLRIAQDLVRTTIAHEIGHVLGLRHNFAGSHAANYEAAARPSLIAAYLRQAEVPANLVVTSSVMDYFPFEEMAIIGHQIKQPQAAFAHDKLAIAALYHKLDLATSPGLPAFCTDHQVGVYVDCDRHTFGASPLAFAQTATAASVEALPEFLANYFVNHAKSPAPGERPQSLTTVNMSSLQVAFQALAPRAKALNTILKGRRSLAIDGPSPDTNELSRKQRDEAYARLLASDLARLGGWPAVLEHVPADFVERSQAAFASLIRSPAYQSGVGPGGAYEFSEDELVSMTQAANQFFVALYDAFAKIDLIQLASVPNLAALSFAEAEGSINTSVADSFADFLANKAAATILAAKPEPMLTYLKVPAKATVQGLQRVVTLQLAMRNQIELLEFGLALNSASPLPQEALDAAVSEQLNLKIDALMAQPEMQAILATIDFDKIAASLIPASQRLPLTTETAATAMESDANVDESADDSPGNSADNHAYASIATSLPPPPYAEISYGIPDWLDAGLPAGNKSLASSSEDASPEAAAATVSAAQKAAVRASVEVYAQLPMALHAFSRSFPERLLAASLLDNQRGPQLDFAISVRAKLRRLFHRQLLQDLRQKDFSKLTYEDQPKPMNVWLQENLKIYKALAPNAL